jgi:hypothetical protein
VVDDRQAVPDVVVTPSLDARKLRADFLRAENAGEGRRLPRLGRLRTEAESAGVRERDLDAGILFTRSATEGLNLVA